MLFFLSISVGDEIFGFSVVLGDVSLEFLDEDFARILSSGDERGGGDATGVDVWESEDLFACRVQSCAGAECTRLSPCVGDVTIAAISSCPKW
jgi:hypothetical protein